MNRTQAIEAHLDRIRELLREIDRLPVLPSTEEELITLALLYHIATEAYAAIVRMER
jgi:hypothetical protein